MMPANSAAPARIQQATCTDEGLRRPAQACDTRMPPRRVTRARAVTNTRRSKYSTVFHPLTTWYSSVTQAIVASRTMKCFRFGISSLMDRLRQVGAG